MTLAVFHGIIGHALFVGLPADVQLEADRGSGKNCRAIFGPSAFDGAFVTALAGIFG